MSAKEREGIRIDFWDRIVRSQRIPALNDDEIEYLFSALCTKKTELFLANQIAEIFYVYIISCRISREEYY